jgi:putative transposase
MPYWECYYHLIWATYRRESIINAALETTLYGAIKDKAHLLNCTIMAANGMEDHVHLVVSMPPSVSISEFVKQVKGFTSYVLNGQHETTDVFKWQGGYGVLTLGKQRLSMACDYVNRQKEHHQHHTLYASLEHIEE